MIVIQYNLTSDGGGKASSPVFLEGGCIGMFYGNNDVFNGKNREDEEWKKVQPLIEMRVKHASSNKYPDLYGKIVRGRMAFHNGRKIFQLSEYNDCNAWRTDCADCGLCPSWDDVVEITHNDDREVALDNINIEGLIKILFSKGFPCQFTPPEPIYISLNGVFPYFTAIYRSKGEISIEGMDGICRVCLKKEFPYWIIEDSLPFNLMGPIKKQILKGLIVYWFELIKPSGRVRKMEGVSGVSNGKKKY